MRACARRRLFLSFFVICMVYGVIFSLSFVFPVFTSSFVPAAIMSEQARQDLEIELTIQEAEALKSQKEWDAALALLDAGLKKYPNSDRLHTHKGGWYYDQHSYAEAASWYEKAHKLNPRESSYPSNAAMCYQQLHMYPQEKVWLEKALAIRKNLGQLISLMDVNWRLNDWRDYDAQATSVIEETRQELAVGKTVSMNSFLALHLPFTPNELLLIAVSHAQATKINTQSKHGVLSFPYVHGYNRTRGDTRIRVGYLSYDFRNHAVGLQIQDMFRVHDRSKFEVFCYNVNDGKKDSFEGDTIYEKIKRDCDHMVQIGGWSVKNAARLIRDQGIQILVDLLLYTAGARMDIFVAHPAPIQVGWLGLATTTGSESYDYLVGDEVVIPEHNRKYYLEHIAFMPHAYHILNHRQMHSPIQPPLARPDGSMPPNRTLYCNFQNNLRWEPYTFSRWCDIVKKVPDSALVLKYYTEESAKNLRNEARQRGLVVSDNITESQILFMPGGAHNMHLRMKGMCDVYLDTHHYNGHSTTGDMLWAGVPMVTYPGESMAGRAAASFARAAGFYAEFVTRDWEDYQERAVFLGRNTTARQDLRTRLEAARMTMALYDVEAFVRHLEVAYTSMWERYAQKLQPADIYVPDLRMVQ